MPQIPQGSTTSFVPFTKEKQDALVAAQQQKLKSVEHFPKKPNVPGYPSVPVMTPVPDQARAPVPVTAHQHNMLTQPMGHASGISVFTPQTSVDQAAQAQADALFATAAQGRVQSSAPAPVAAAIPPAMNQVPMVKPGFTTAIADGESMSLDLPSRFAYYGFQDVYARPFVAKHLAKLQKAHRERSMLPIVEAVSAVCFTTDPRYQGDPIAFDLSLPDFFFVLYWLRLNSFTKSNYVHTAECDNPEHVERVSYSINMEKLTQACLNGEITEEEFLDKQKKALPKESLQISQLVTSTDLKINELETIPDPAIYHFSETSRMFFRPPTMRDVLEFAEAPQMRDPEQRTEYAFLAQLASHIQHMDERMTLAQRIAIVENATPDQVELIKDFEREIRNYGVVEKIKVQCKECGATKESKISIAAHSFFPFNKH